MSKFDFEDFESFDKIQIREELEYKNIKPLEIELKPIIQSVEMVYIVQSLEKPVINIEVSVWEKIYFIYNQYKLYLDLIIKFSTLIIPIFKIVKWIQLINKKK